MKILNKGKRTYDLLQEGRLCNFFCWKIRNILARLPKDNKIATHTKARGSKVCHQENWYSSYLIGDKN